MTKSFTGVTTLLFLLTSLVHGQDFPILTGCHVGLTNGGFETGEFAPVSGTNVSQILSSRFLVFLNTFPTFSTICFFLPSRRPDIALCWLSWCLVGRKPIPVPTDHTSPLNRLARLQQRKCTPARVPGRQRNGIFHDTGDRPTMPEQEVLYIVRRQLAGFHPPPRRPRDKFLPFGCHALYMSSPGRFQRSWCPGLATPHLCLWSREKWHRNP